MASVNGTHALPAYAIPQFIGAMLGRYYFQQRYGERKLESLHAGSGRGLLLRHGSDWHGGGRARAALQKRFALAVLSQNRMIKKARFQPETGLFWFCLLGNLSNPTPKLNSGAHSNRSHS